jgi:electron transfer flavoprotein beta subunit
MLRITVCIKQVPHPDHFSRIVLDTVKQTIIREGIPTVINPLDRHALEAGLTLREIFKGEVTAFSMGPIQAKEVLQEALAVGVDRAVLLCDRDFAGADTLATAYTLAAGIKKSGIFDLIITGSQTVDSGTAQVGPQVAELLGIPHVSDVMEIVVQDAKTLIVKRKLEGGYVKLKVQLPALLTVVKEINRPRLPTILGIMEATRKEITTWGLSDLEVDPEVVGLNGSPTQVIGAFIHKTGRQAEILTGVPEEAVKEAVQKLRKIEALN